MDRPLVLFGLGKIADVVFDCLTQESDRRVVAFTCEREHCDRESWHGRPTIPYERLVEAYPPDNHDLMIAIGYQNINRERARLCAIAREYGYTLVTHISPRASLHANVSVGETCLIMEGVSIQAGARVGSNVFLWSNATIGHHSSVRDHCYFASGTTIGGGASVGERCFAGLNATVGHEIEIGDGCFLGAGTLITRSCPDQSVFVRADTDRHRLDSDRFVAIASSLAH